MQTIGMVTIGEAPRDDVVPAMQRIFPPQVRILQRGALDNLTPAQIAQLAPTADEMPLVTRRRDGSSVQLSHARIVPRIQECVDDLVAQGAELITVLCGGDWSAIRSEKLIINPGRLFPNVISSLAMGRKLGVIKPAAGQVAFERERYCQMGIEAVVTSASPYGGAARLDAAHAAAVALREAGVDLVWMTCIGMDEPMRAVVVETVQKPTILAQSLLAHILNEFLQPDDLATEREPDAYVQRGG